jgi:hypothetical protein
LIHGFLSPYLQQQQQQKKLAPELFLVLSTLGCQLQMLLEVISTHWQEVVQ